MPQNIVGNNRTISQKLGELNSVVREKIVKDSSAKTTVITGHPGGIPKSVPLQKQQQKLHTMWG